MKRRVAREKALQALFQIDMSGIEPEEALLNVLEEEKDGCLSTADRASDSLNIRIPSMRS